MKRCRAAETARTRITPPDISFCRSRKPTRWSGTSSPADVTKFLGVMLNDKTDGASCSGMYTTGTGTVNSATSAGVLTGTGTDWTTSLSPGDSIFPATKNPWVVVSVDSDTQLHYRTTNLAGDQLFRSQPHLSDCPPVADGQLRLVLLGEAPGLLPFKSDRSIPAFGRHLACRSVRQPISHQDCRLSGSRAGDGR